MTKDELTKKSLPELRALAKKMKINPAGKRPADLIREILKTTAKKKGKGTAADPIKKKKTKTVVKPSVKKETAPPAKTREDPPPKTVGLHPKMVEQLAAAIEQIPKIATAVEALTGKLTEVCEFCEIEPPGEPKKKRGRPKKAAPPPEPEEDDEEEEAEEDEEEEEEDEEEAGEEEEEEEDEEAGDDEEEEDGDIPADEEEEDEEEEEVEDDDETEATIDISMDEIKTANLDRLKEIADQLEIDYSDIAKKPKALRERIVEWLEENGEEADDDEGELGPKAEKMLPIPEHLRPGAKVKVDVNNDGNWTVVRVGAVDVLRNRVLVRYDDQSGDFVPYEQTKPLVSERSKKDKKKAAGNKDKKPAKKSKA